MSSRTYLRYELLRTFRNRRFFFLSLGFPVVLRMNVPLVNVRGAWTLDLNLNDLSRRVLEVLALGHAKLTGSKRAEQILANWKTYGPMFRKVMPIEYRRALAEVAKKQTMQAAE